jgi:hypothetical protein
MTKIKTLGAVIFLSGAAATPAFAQDGPTHHGRAYNRGAYNQLNAPFATPRTRDGQNVENFGSSGWDPSRVGGKDPDLNPASS